MIKMNLLTAIYKHLNLLKLHSIMHWEPQKKIYDCIHIFCNGIYKDDHKKRVIVQLKYNKEFKRIFTRLLQKRKMFTKIVSYILFNNKINDFDIACIYLINGIKIL